MNCPVFGLFHQKISEFYLAWLSWKKIGKVAQKIAFCAVSRRVPTFHRHSTLDFFLPPSRFIEENKEVEEERATHKKKLKWNEESEQEEKEEEEEDELLLRMKREAVTGSIRNNSPTTRCRHCYSDAGNHSLCFIYYLFIYLFFCANYQHLGALNVGRCVTFTLKRERERERESEREWRRRCQLFQIPIQSIVIPICWKFVFFSVYRSVDLISINGRARVYLPLASDGSRW